MSKQPGRSGAIVAARKGKKGSVFRKKAKKPKNLAKNEPTTDFVKIGDANLEHELDVDTLNDPVPCFIKAHITCPDDDEVVAANLSLMEYASELIETIEPMLTKMYPESKKANWRKTSDVANVCFNPLMAMRAWGLLANVAEGKTFRDIAKYLNKKLAQHKYGFKKSDDLNQVLISFHVDIEEDVDGCVRLFTDIQDHLLPDDQILREASNYYGGKSNRAAIQHLCFATDPDGFYSCHRINEEVAKSTNNAVRYVVPEKCAPNWRSSMVLVSASDCTFIWKTEGEAHNIDLKFYDEHENPSTTPALKAKANIRISPDDSIIRLQGDCDDFHLFLSKHPLSSQTIKDIADSDVWSNQTKTVCVPHSVISTPIPLFEDTYNDPNLKRVYSSEKSELFRLHSNQFEIKANFITLWDHYHKCNFKIATTAGARYQTKTDGLEPHRAHVCTDDYQSDGFSFNKPEKTNNCLFTYYEDHLDQNYRIMEPVEPNQVFQDISDCDEVYNRTFYFVMTRHCMNKQMILCAGRFSNTPYVHEEMEVIKKSDGNKV